MLRKRGREPQKSWDELHESIRPEYKAIVERDRMEALGAAKQLARIPQIRELLSFERLYDAFINICHKRGREKMLAMALKQSMGLKSSSTLD